MIKRGFFAKLLLEMRPHNFNYDEEFRIPRIVLTQVRLLKARRVIYFFLLGVFVLYIKTLVFVYACSH